jgi:hypothetical protein
MVQQLFRFIAHNFLFFVFCFFHLKMVSGSLFTGGTRNRQREREKEIEEKDELRQEFEGE